MNIWQKVLEFHKAFNLLINDIPIILFFKDLNDFEPLLQTTQQSLEQCAGFINANCTRSLRIKLLLEEVAEYIEAERTNDLIAIADALTDIHYITAGTEISYGLPGAKIFEHIHNNNMSKLGADGKPVYRADGKILKPDGWIAPSIEQFVVTGLDFDGAA